jgi:hypothetical protein
MRVLADMLYSDWKKRENADKYRFFRIGGDSTRNSTAGSGWIDSAQYASQGRFNAKR